MTGRKTLAEVRAELEEALGAGPAGDGDVAESLRRFLASGPGKPVTPNRAAAVTGGTGQGSGTSQVSEAPPAGERGR